jgi:hypothetical protein
LILPLATQLVIVATTLFPQPQLVGAFSLVLLCPIILFPSWQRVLDVVQMGWLSLVVLGKMVYDLDVVEAPNDEWSAVKIEWAGFWNFTSTARTLSLYFAAIFMISIQGFFDKWAKIAWDGTQTRSLFSVQPVDYMHHVLSALQQFINSCVFEYGFEVCLALTVAASLTRLNAISLYYLIYVGVLLRIYPRKNSASDAKRQRQWAIFTAFVVLLFLAQYATALGMPPPWTYPFEVCVFAFCSLNCP